MFLRGSGMRAYIFHSAWKPQATAFSALMLAKATLLAVGLFLAWPDKWSEVCVCVISSTCDFASSHFAFWVCFFIPFFFLFSFLWFSGNESPKWPSVFLMDGILSVVASWFLLNPTVVCTEMLFRGDPSVQSLWWPFGFDLDQCPYTPLQKDPCCSLWTSRF